MLGHAKAALTGEQHWGNESASMQPTPVYKANNIGSHKQRALRCMQTRPCIHCKAPKTRHQKGMLHSSDPPALNRANFITSYMCL